MRRSRHPAPNAVAGALVLVALAATAGAVAALQSRRPVTADPVESGTAVSAAAYRMPQVGEAGLEARLPRWAVDRGASGDSTGIAVLNLGADTANVNLQLVDYDGNPLACTGCTTVLGVGASYLYWLPDLQIGGAQPAEVGEATVTADQRILAAAVDVPLLLLQDHALYAAIPSGGELSPPTTPQQPLVVDNAAVGSIKGPVYPELYLLNLDHQQQVTALSTFFPWDASYGPAIRTTIEPGQSEVVPLALLSSVPPTQYAVVVSGQVPLGLVTRHEWPDRLAASMGEAVWHDSEIEVPLVMKNADGRCSIVAVRNTNAVSATAVAAELYEPAGGPAVLQVGLGLPASATTGLDLCADSRFDKLPDGFVGSMVLRSANYPISAEALLSYAGRPGIAEYGGSAPWMAGQALYAPLLHAGWTYTPDITDMPVYESRLALRNPSRTPVVFTATYVGSRGTCAGKSYAGGTQSIPGLGLVTLAPGPSGSGILPEGCVASAHIEAEAGQVLGVVLDEGLAQAPTPTPSTTVTTSTATLTATPSATSFPVTDTPVPTATASVTERATNSPTSTGSPTEPPATGTAATPQVATATFWPTRTPPTEPTRPPVTQVPPDSWKRADHTNSLLPYDYVRFLEVDREGNTWIRLIDPRGGPDAIVTVNRAGVWETYRSGLRAAISALSANDLGRLQNVRDFFDRDGQERTWIGPQFLDADKWQVLAADDSSPVGGVHYEERVVLDPTDRGWVPLRATTDCIPPASCGNTGLRIFDAGGQMAGDVELDTLSDPAAYGVDHVNLVAQGGSNGPGVAAAADPGRSQSMAQGAGNAAWVVAPDRYFVLPSTEPGYYPYLDPGEFLVTGLRNSGYATAATLSPSGLLQVATWVELDLGNQVQHHIFLSTLHGDSWEVEDLTTAPLFTGDVEFERVVGMDYCTSGELWLLTAAGAVAARRDGERTDGAWTVYSSGSGLFHPGDLPTDIACGEDGAVWIGSRGGLLGYGFQAPPVRIYAPYTAAGGE